MAHRSFGASLQERGCPPTPARWYSSRAAGVFSGLRCSAPRCSRRGGQLSAKSEARRLNHARGCPLLPGCLKPGGRSRSPAPMESVDRWPLASLLLQIPGGSRPAGAAVRRRVRGVWTLHPRAVCRSLPAPAKAIPGRIYLRADRFLGGYSGGNWMVICVLPVRRGCRGGRALSGAPSRVKPTLHAASSEALGGGPRCVSPDARPATLCRN